MDNQSGTSNSALESSLQVVKEPALVIKTKHYEDLSSNLTESAALQFKNITTEDPPGSSGSKMTKLWVKPFAKLAESATSSHTGPRSNKGSPYLICNTLEPGASEASNTPRLPACSYWQNSSSSRTWTPGGAERNPTDLQIHLKVPFYNYPPRDDSFSRTKSVNRPHQLEETFPQLNKREEAASQLQPDKLRASERANNFLRLNEGAQVRSTSDFACKEESMDLKDDRLLASAQSTESQSNSSDELKPTHADMIVKHEIDLGVDLVVGQEGIKVELEKVYLPLVPPNERWKDKKHLQLLVSIVKSTPDYDPSGELACRACEFKTKNSKAMPFHTNIFHSPKNQFQCLLCPRKNQSFNHLVFHYRTVHLREKLKQCRVCGETFDWHVSYATHRKICVKPYACHLCTVTFAHEELLQKHIMRIHQLQTKVSCPHCDRLIQIKGLDKHIAVRHLVRNFRCRSCDKAYVSQAHLDNHYKKTSHGRLYSCEYCDFLGPSNKLKQHLLTHPVERSKRHKLFMCNEGCRRVFSTKKSLVKHLPLHSLPKEQWFICEYDKCRAAFEKFSFRRLHYMHTKHNQRFRCTICSVYFSTELVLATHYKSKHVSKLVSNPLNPGESSKGMDEEQQTEIGESYDAYSVSVSTSPAMTQDQQSSLESSSDLWRTDGMGSAGSTSEITLPDIGEYLDCKIETDSADDFNEQTLGARTDEPSDKNTMLTGEIGCQVEIKQEVVDTNTEDGGVTEVETEEIMEFREEEH